MIVQLVECFGTVLSTVASSHQPLLDNKDQEMCERTYKIYPQRHLHDCRVSRGGFEVERNTEGRWWRECEEVALTRARREQCMARARETPWRLALAPRLTRMTRTPHVLTLESFRRALALIPRATYYISTLCLNREGARSDASMESEQPPIN